MKTREIRRKRQQRWDVCDAKKEKWSILRSLGCPSTHCLHDPPPSDFISPRSILGFLLIVRYDAKNNIAVSNYFNDSHSSWSSCKHWSWNSGQICKNTLKITWNLLSRVQRFQLPQPLLRTLPSLTNAAHKCDLVQQMVPVDFSLKILCYFS